MGDTEQKIAVGMCRYGSDFERKIFIFIEPQVKLAFAGGI
jgi:hypothetical protein